MNARQMHNKEIADTAALIPFFDALRNEMTSSG
jgi:hypothetical protein